MRALMFIGTTMLVKANNVWSALLGEPYWGTILAVNARTIVRIDALEVNQAQLIFSSINYFKPLTT